MADRIVDVTGKRCPIPVSDTRKAISRAKDGEILEIIGNDEESKGEILLAIKELGMELVNLENKGIKWHIFVKKI